MANSFAGRVKVIAHRGASTIAPENTLPAFLAATRLGVDMVELDCRETADGVPVVFHDEFLDRTTDAVERWGGTKIPLASKKLEELRKLDVGSWFRGHDEIGAQRHNQNSPLPSAGEGTGVRGPFAGTRIFTVAEAIDAIRPHAMTLIERKSGNARRLVDVIVQRNALDRVGVMAFDWPFLAECHALAPDLLLVALGDEEFRPTMLNQIAATGATAIGWADQYTDAALIGTAHHHGWQAYVWTVDKPDRMRVLAFWGIDGIITNRPETLLRELGNA